MGAREKMEEAEEEANEARLGEYGLFKICDLLLQPGRWLLILGRQ